MRRRDLLAAAGTSLVGFAGCLSRTSVPSQPTDGETTEPPTTSTPTSQPTPFGGCGPAATPLSEQFVEEQGDPDFCFKGATADLVVENERDEATEISVEVAGEDGPILNETYDLDPGERIVEWSVLPAHDEHDVDAMIEGEQAVSGTWPTPSCYRRGIAVTPTRIQFGLVAPLEGPGDTQHDCYAGDDASLSIYNGETAQSGTLRIVDHCADSTTEETFDLDPDETAHFRDVLVSGGVYDVTIDVEDGGSNTYEFDGQCWGLTASIDADGEVSIRQILID